MERENFRSRLGFLLVSAGCAIGIGNVWKFPFITGQYGGGVFVLFYLVFLVIMGAPVLMMELAVGRGSRKSAVGGYKALEPKGSVWHIHGWVAIIGCYLLMMYYTTVSGWMLNYAVNCSGRYSCLQFQPSEGRREHHKDNDDRTSGPYRHTRCPQHDSFRSEGWPQVLSSS